VWDFLSYPCPDHFSSDKTQELASMGWPVMTAHASAACRTPRARVCPCETWSWAVSLALPSLGAAVLAAAVFSSI